MSMSLIATLRMIRATSAVAELKAHRNWGDFLADRIVQAATEPTLLAFGERLTALVQARAGEIHPGTVTAFIGAASAQDAPAVLDWLREFPRVASMLALLPAPDFDAAVATLPEPVVAIQSGTAVPIGAHEIGLRVKCLSPLAHGADTKAGNATLFRRMQVLSTTGAILTLPFYSGNAVRGQMRDLLADDLLSALGLAPRRDQPPVALWFFHALYAGGALEEDSPSAKAMRKRLGDHGSIRAEGIREFRQTLPALSLLGCALGNRVLAGRVRIGDLRPVCRQWANGEAEVGSLFEWLYLTRREDHEQHAENSGMIADTEALKAGTELVGGMEMDLHATPMERAALGRGLKLLAARGYLGAENRRGLGKCEIALTNAPDATPYEEYLRDHANDIKGYLDGIGALDVLPPKTEKKPAKESADARDDAAGNDLPL